MFLETSSMSRKQFLQRSLLGFGSTFILPSLLQGCKDHIIDPGPIPGSGTTYPPFLGAEIDWNDDAKIVIKSVLEKTPEVGEILGPLIDIFWPSTKEDVWGEIKGQVETLINQKIDDLVYQTVSQNLTGLEQALTNYLNELKNGTPAEILQSWIATKQVFSYSLPNFQAANYQTALLPLYTQAINMYLALLRDGVAFGQGWGRTAADYQQDLTDLKTQITQSTNYVNTVYGTYRNYLHDKTKPDKYNVEPFRTRNRFDRQMNLTVLEFIDAWPYFDVSVYPNGSTLVSTSTREIYSDPQGSPTDTGDLQIPYPTPLALPTNVTVWGGVRIDAVQLTYPANSGPGGVTTTPRMGDQPSPGYGGSNQPPAGGSFNLSPNNPIVAARAVASNWYFNGAYAANILGELQFSYHDGTATNVMGSTNGSSNGTFDSGWIGFANKALSSIYVHGAEKYAKTAEVVVFGYQHWVSPAAQLNTIKVLYVKTPKEYSAADLAKAFPKAAISASLITEELKAARKAYWESIKARAK